MLLDYLNKGLSHGCYVIGLVLALAVAAFIAFAVIAMIIFACTRDEA